MNHAPQLPSLGILINQTRSKARRLMILHVDSVMTSTTFFKSRNILSGFQLSNKQFDTLFGKTQRIRKFVYEHILINIQQGYCIDQSNYQYNRFKLRKHIGVEVLSVKGKDPSKTLNNIGIITHKNSIVCTDITGYKNKRGQNLMLISKTDGSGRRYDPTTNIPKFYEHIVFEGNFSYDIDVAAPTILSQMYTKITNNTLIHIPHYINNKESLRIEWANDIGVLVKDIKIVVNSLFFGGIIPSEAQLDVDFDFEFRIQQTLSKSQIKKLLQNDSFIGMRNETKVMMKGIAEHYRTHDNNLTNLAGFTKHYDKWLARKVCFHLYVGVEVEILNLAQRILFDQAMPTFWRTKHDGFVTNVDIGDVNALADIIEENTGYQITYSKQQL